MNRKNFIVGMNIHNKGYSAYPEENFERNLDYCEQMGINLVNFNCTLGDNDADNRLAYIKSVADAVHRRGMKFCLCVDDRTCFDRKLEEIEERDYENQKKICEYLKGSVDIYEVGPEFDVPAMHTDMGDVYNIIGDQFDGMVPEEYDPVRLAKTAPSVRGRLRAIREIDPDVKTMVAFAWWHTYYVEFLRNNGCEWDIMGVDWYSDAEKASSFLDLLDWIKEHFGDIPVLICETNFWGYNYKDKTPEEGDAEQAEWVCRFCEHLFNDTPDRCLGLIYYELMDELCFDEENGGFHGEAHFGFVKCNKDGSNPVPKPSVKALGETVEKLMKKLGK